jgi:RNA polymerase sigma factor (sigma-70 family)
MQDMMHQVEPLIPALRRYARALVRQREAADDLVQDSLERAISRWHLKRAEGDTRAWLFTILHNLAINRLRQQAGRGRHLSMEDAEEGAFSRPAGQEERIRLHELLTALDTLPDELRTVLLLVSVEDLSYAEAARVLDIPIGTVMSRLSRARERLRMAVNEVPAAGTQPVQGKAGFLRRIK